MLRLVLVFAVATCGAAVAAEDAAGTDSSETTVVRPLEMPIDQFEILLRPRSKQDLEQVASQWMESLQEKATEIARAQVTAKRSGGGVASAKVADLTTQQDRVAQEYRAVINALENKGGDVADHRAYLKSVTAASTTDNPALLTTRALKWLQSPEGGIKLGLNLLAFVVCIVVAKLAANITGSIVQRTMSMSKVKVTELLASFFVNTSRNAVMALGIVIGLSFLGIPVGPFLAAMGAVGFIVGFALQDTLGNFASGVMILLYRPYDLEDVVNVAGVTGKVRTMTLVSTTLLTPDNQLVVVPNKSIWGGIITNITGNTTRRIDLTFGISYDDDVRHAQNVLEQLVASHPLVLQEPAPIVRVHELADSSVNLICRPWVKTADYWDVHWDLTRMVKETFDAEGISIPFPQQDVHMHAASGDSSINKSAA